ncbi:MAG: carboxypeptidase regulatory-like domain-containing protein [Acidobacteria bacterium]|nr:carboxypeptidase regulatory-like domain-containing protein [Acidobacteriota bacterium]
MIKTFAVFLLAGALAILSGQVLPVGTVDGTVSDSTGGAMPGVPVTLVNLDTNQSRTATTNGSGYYFFPLVPPGRYQLTAEKAGFKRGTQPTLVRTGIRSTADFSLEVGQLTEQVQVSAKGALLETSTAAVSRNIDKRAITDIPLLGRNVLMLINLAPGITNNSPTNNTTGLIDVDSVSYTSASGANNRTNEFLLDGIPNNISDRVAYIPGVDAVEEFTVQTNALDAEYGHGGGMYVNVSTRGGTNEFHGNLYEYFRNDKLNANSFFNNRAGNKRPVFRFNQYGLTAGGPVVIPKLFNGKDKLFWFFNFEGLQRRTPQVFRITVPTELQKSGDFSQTFNVAGAAFQIADPLTTTTGGGQASRQLFPGGRIPANRINPVARNVLARYPAPTSLGDAFTNANNYYSEVAAIYDGENYSLRVDPNLGAHRLFVRWSTNQGFPGSPTVWDIGGKGVGELVGNNRAQTSMGISDAWVLSPSTVVTGQAGFTRWTQQGTYPQFDQTQLGFSPSLVGQMQQRIFPRFDNSDLFFIGAAEGQWFEHTNTFSYNLGFTRSAGSHNMKWGFQGQVKQNNSQGANRPGGQYTFNRAFTQPNPFQAGNNLGHGIASMLLGNASSGFMSLNAATATQSPFYGFYFQDDYKVTSKLTLNVGLRYDLMLGTTERFNKNTFGLDFRVANPIEQAAKTAYATNPIPELTPANFSVRGGMLFATENNRRNVVADRKNWQPRLGFAYRVFPRTVLRGGMGIFYSVWWQPFVNLSGFTSQTDMVTSLDGGLTPADVLSNPFPNGFTPPTGSSLGLRTFLGQSLSVYAYDRKNIRNNRWSFGFQHAVTNDLQIEINYVGQNASNLIVASGAGDSGRSINNASNGTGGAFDQRFFGLGARLNARVPNPFLGLIPQPSALAGPTITVAQLLNPLPQFQNITHTREMGGTSVYHSLQMGANHRLRSGLSLQAAYTFSKQLESLRYVEPSDTFLPQMIGQFDNPHRVSLGLIYELPLGEGRAWKSNVRVLDRIIGGWQWSAMYIYQTGQAVALPQAVATGTSPKRDNATIQNWFNGGALSVMPPFTARRLPFYWGDLRNPAINNWDMAFLKDTAIGRERIKLQFRAEFVNAFNRVWFGGLNTGITSPTYTQLLGQANQPRNIQLGLKLSF